MSDDTPQTPEPGMITRRTLAAGVAWAVPAVAVAGAAPAYAASVTTTTTTLPPCIAGITNDSVNWVVEGVQYQGCSSYCSHKDVRLSFHVASCGTPVTIRVSNVVNNSMWCAWTNTVGTLTKTVAANTSATLTFPDTGNTISGGGNCTIQAYSPTTANDGMHINPCSNGPFFKYEIWYAASTAGSPAVTGFWGDANNPPKPGNATPIVPTGLAICRASVSGTSASFKATWSGPGADSYDLEYQVSTSTSSCNYSATTTVSNLTAPTYTSGLVTNGTRCIRFRVRASNCRGDSAYSGWVELAAGNTVTCGTGRMASAQNGESATVTEPETLTTTAAPKVETLTTTAASKPETLTTTAASKPETLTTTAAPKVQTLTTSAASGS